MPLPSANDVHVDALLTSMSVQYMQDNRNFVSSVGAPIIPVAEESGVYSVWSKADFMRRQFRQISDADPAPEVSFGVDNTPQYFCKTYGGKKLVTDRQRANSTNPIDLDQATVNLLTQQARIERDYQFATNAWTTGVWGTDSTPGTTWEGSSGDPIGDIRTGINAVRVACGSKANTLILGADVWTELQDHTDITDRFKHTQAGVITEELIAQLFGLDKVVVAEGTYNTASAAATVSMSDIFDPDDALLLYSQPSPSLEAPSALYTFSWSKFDQPDVAEAGAAVIKRWRNEDPDGDWMRALMSFDVKVVASDCGYFFRTAVA